MRDAVWLAITREQESIPTTASTSVACRRLSQQGLSCPVLPYQTWKNTLSKG